MIYPSDPMERVLETFSNLRRAIERLPGLIMALGDELDEHDAALVALQAKEQA